MKQVIFSGLMVLGIIFSSLYATKSSVIVTEDNYRVIESIGNQESIEVHKEKKNSWNIAQSSITNLLRKTDNIPSYSMKNL